MQYTITVNIQIRNHFQFVNCWISDISMNQFLLTAVLKLVICVSDLWKKNLESYHDIFLERENHRSDESKRPGHSISSSELLGFEGSFRKLDVD